MIKIPVRLEAIHHGLEEITQGAEAIILLGGLWNGLGLDGNPTKDKCCRDPAMMIVSNMKHLLALQKAWSINKVAELLGSLKESGYINHSEEDSQRDLYAFSCLRS